MTVQTRSDIDNQNSSYEQTLIGVVRALPKVRAVQLVDFARFLKAQTLIETLIQEDDVIEIEEDNAQWDALFESDDAQNLLDKLADEALAEHEAGRTKSMAFTKEGRVIAE